MARTETQGVERRRSGRSERRRVLVRWLTAASILLVVSCLVFFLTVRALPHIAMGQIGELVNARIEAELVDFDLDGSVHIEGLVIRPETEQDSVAPILKAKEVHARFSIGSMLLLGPRLKEIRIGDFVFDAQFDLGTGRWNVAGLKLNISKSGSGKMPAVHLEKGVLQYSKVSEGKADVAMVVPLEARFGLDEETLYGYSFEITTAELSGGPGKSKLTGFWKPGSVTLTGGISSTDVPSIERTWAIDVLAAELKYAPDSTYSLDLRIKDLHSTHSPEADTFALVKPAFLKQSDRFTALQKFFGRYRPAGVADMEVVASGRLDRLNESSVSGKIHCKDISICDRKFPYAIEHIVGEANFDSNSIFMNRLSGRHGETNLVIDGWSRGTGPNLRYQIRVTSDKMVLDKDLYEALSQGQKKLWADYSPSGLVATDYRLSRSSQTDRKRALAMEFLDAHMEYRHFPYPLANLKGELFFDQDSITVSDVVSQIGQRRITLNGRITERRADRPVYYLSIKADNIPLDSTLAAALPATQKNLYDQFDITGLADAEVKVFTPKDAPAPTSFLAHVTFKDSSLTVREVCDSPLPISDVSAKATLTPDSISIDQLTGQYAHSPVSLKGAVQFTDQEKVGPYHLTVSGKNAQLTDDLISLLPASLQKIVSGWQPKGNVDVSVDLIKASDGSPLDYEVVVDCLGGSVIPEHVAYQLNDITGKLTVTKSGITLQDVRAAPAGDTETTANKPSIKIDGNVELADSVFEKAELQISASDMSLNEQLGAALPKNFGAFYKKLSPSGRFDLDFNSVKISNAGDGEKTVDFAGNVRLKACNFEMLGTRAELDAALKTKGTYNTAGGMSEGHMNLNADSLTAKGKSLTNLTADFEYDAQKHRWVTDRLISDFYGGRLIGKLEFRQPPDDAPSYQLRAGFDNVDFKKFVAGAKGTEDNRTTGTMAGELSVGSRVGDTSSQIGRCRLSVTHMQVGEIKPLVKLSSVVGRTEQRNFAFERMLVDSYIKRDKLLVQKFDLSGESLAFNGSGSMDLPSENVNLTLTARGPRPASAEPSALQSLTEGLGGGVVRIEVTGNAYDPQVETKALPVIGDSLKILGTPR
ncbi:MAG: hypothetical protein JSU70_18055 [Phycisphaerales bacterium]|nr:MAG: hypothetical protein JSU70_18055 [Phycisphaerales bacterium]